MLRTHNPPNQPDNYFFKCFRPNHQTFEKFLLQVDFNAADTEHSLPEFLKQHTIKYMKEKRFFKIASRTTCINLFLTNNPNSFQHTMKKSTGLFDFHKMIIAALKC